MLVDCSSLDIQLKQEKEEKGQGDKCEKKNEEAERKGEEEKERDRKGLKVYI